MTTVELNMKSEHNLYLACEDSTTCFLLYTFSYSSLALLASTVHWFRCFLFLNAANCQVHSVLDSAKHVRCRGPAALSSIVKNRRSFLSSIARLGIRHPLMSVQCTWTWHLSSSACTWAQIDITERDRHVHTHVHCENRSLIQSLVVMCSAIMKNHNRSLIQSLTVMHLEIMKNRNWTH